MMPGENTSIMEKFFWAYCVMADGKCTLIRCNSIDEAILEHGRLRMSAAKVVGHVTRKTSEADLRKHCRGQGWKVVSIRWFKAEVKFN